MSSSGLRSGVRFQIDSVHSLPSMAFCFAPPVVILKTTPFSRCSHFTFRKTSPNSVANGAVIRASSSQRVAQHNHDRKNDAVATRTKSWISNVVIGLGLCPFAEPAVTSDTVRYVITEAAHETNVRKLFFDEVELLMSTTPQHISTTLIVMPHFAEDDFLRFHALSSLIELEISDDEHLVDSVLIAAFHPAFRYADSPEHDALNFEKRAPYPIINILRTQLLDQYISQGKTQTIPNHNKQVLERLGSEQLKRLYHLT